MRKFNEFINESITDQMTPKSDDEIKVASVTQTLKTYPNTKYGEELTACVNLLLDNEYVYEGTNIEDRGEYRQKERQKNVTWFKYTDPDHYVSFTDDTKISELKDRLELYKKRYKI